MEEPMHAQTFDTLTRRTAGAISRRRSLLTLGGAAVAGALATPTLAQASKDSKKAKKKKKKKCNGQINQCNDFFTALCADPNFDCEPGEFEAALFCCSQLRDCRGGEAVSCFFGLLIPT
jgi:hypothetical protein